MARDESRSSSRPHLFRVSKIPTVKHNGLWRFGAVLLLTLSIAAPVRADPLLSSAADQTFTVGQAATLISAITITDDGASPVITKKNGIRIRIPSSFNMTWDDGIGTVTIVGSAAGKVDSNLKKYEDGDLTLVLDVTTDFVAGDQITISGAQFLDFSAISAVDNLELDIDDNGSGDVFDDKTIEIISDLLPSISSAADQFFTVGDPATLISTITITDNAVAPTITGGTDIRIRIPSTFNMTWDTSITTVTIGGSAAGKVSTTLMAYEDGDQTLVLNVNTDFVAGDQITVSDPQFTDFSAASTADNLELEVDNENVVSATDDKTITIGVPDLLVLKTSLTIEDPINGTTNPKAIPLATVLYLVDVTNRGIGTVDADSLSISDPVPANMALRVADYDGGNPGPVAFVDGATASDLSYSFTSLGSTTDDVEFSDDNQATWTYTPVDSGDGTDPAVTDIRINPTGLMAGSRGAGDPSFQVLFKVVVQ